LYGTRTQLFAGKTKLEKAELDEMALYRQSDPQRSFYSFCQDFRLPPSAPLFRYGNARTHCTHRTHFTHGFDVRLSLGEEADPAQPSTTEAESPKKEEAVTAAADAEAPPLKPVAAAAGSGRGRGRGGGGGGGARQAGRGGASAAHDKLEREKPSDDSIVRRWRRNDLKKSRPWYRSIYEEWVQAEQQEYEHRNAPSASALAAYYDE
jgi:hypothetical protein